MTKPLTPYDIAGETEHSQQSAFICWCGQMVRDGHSQIDWVHAIPNGGERNKIVAAKMKKEGARKGVLDIFMPYPIMPLYAGLYIEFKKPSLKEQAVKNGGLSKEQVEFKKEMESRQFSVKVAYDWLQAASHVVEYLRHEQLSPKPLPS